MKNLKEINIKKLLEKLNLKELNVDIFDLQKKSKNSKDQRPNLVAKYIAIKYSDILTNLPVEYSQGVRVFRTHNMEFDIVKLIRELAAFELLQWCQKGKLLIEYAELLKIVLGNGGKSTLIADLGRLQLSFTEIRNALDAKEKGNSIHSPNIIAEYILKAHFKDQAYVKELCEKRLEKEGYYISIIEAEDKINGKTLLADMQKKIREEYKEIKQTLGSKPAEIEVLKKYAEKVNDSKQILSLDYSEAYSEWALAEDLQDCQTTFPRRSREKNRALINSGMNLNASMNMKRPATNVLKDINKRSIPSNQRDAFLYRLRAQSNESLHAQNNPTGVTEEDPELSAFLSNLPYEQNPTQDLCALLDGDNDSNDQVSDGYNKVDVLPLENPLNQPGSKQEDLFHSIGLEQEQPTVSQQAQQGDHIELEEVHSKFEPAHIDAKTTRLTDEEDFARYNPRITILVQPEETLVNQKDSGTDIAPEESKKSIAPKGKNHFHFLKKKICAHQARALARVPTVAEITVSTSVEDNRQPTVILPVEQTSPITFKGTSLTLTFLGNKCQITNRKDDVNSQRLLYNPK